LRYVPVDPNYKITTEFS